MLGKYIKIYFWQFISILLNFGTLFVVTPFLSSNPSLFGIYTIIISLNIFLSYADLGFISAGFKYASESYAKGDFEEETKLIGFVGFIFSIFVGLFAVVILALAYDPQRIVSNLNQPGEIVTARNLMLILAIFAPTFILQRILQLVYAVRLEDYHFQRLVIVFNVIKILSTFYFFKSGNYQIVGYFLFTQICNVFTVVGGVLLARYRLKYNVALLFRSFRYSKVLFAKTQKLAFSSIILTISWILYYQLDPFVIGKMAGSEAVAVYAIGLTLITYIRSLFGIIFSPFSARFNHYIGVKDNEGLKKVFLNVLALTLPVTVFPIICMAVTTKELVINWVGPNYVSSVVVAQFLILCFVFNFITSPVGILVVAFEKVKMIYWSSIMLPLIYWLGIAATWSIWGLTSFGIFKLISFFLSALFYYFLSCKLLNIKLTDFLRKICLPAVMPIIIITALSYFAKNYIPVGHNKINLLYYLIITGIICFIGMVVYYFNSEVFRNYMVSITTKLRINLPFKTAGNG
jgi:O-antigen/teichoic acid export membrane protein